MKNLSVVFLLTVTLAAVSCLNTREPEISVLSFEEQLEQDVQTINDYLISNVIEAEIHDSGIHFVTQTVGEGANPVIEDSVTVIYQGSLLSDGTVFDESTDGAKFQLDQLIEAWQIMIPLMKEGGKITIYAPSGYCYGPFGITNVIPPNANLIFDIELVEVHPQ